MTINELSEILDTARQLGYGSSSVHLDDSRDGTKSYPNAKASFVDVGSQGQPEKILTFKYA